MRKGDINQNLSNKNIIDTTKNYRSMKSKVGKPHDISVKVRINKLRGRIPPSHTRRREPKAGESISNLISFSKYMG
jgi:hypothetical protein